MADGYLGETVIENLEDTPFAGWCYRDWILYLTARYGFMDGSHHKAEMLQDIVKICTHCKIIVKLAKWEDGTEEYRINFGENSQQYDEWVEENGSLTGD